MPKLGLAYQKCTLCSSSDTHHDMANDGVDGSERGTTPTERKRPARRPRSRFGKAFVPYVPPARAARTQQLANEHERAMLKQQQAWLTMKKRINGVINRINTSNIKKCAKDLLQLNIIRGKGLFCKSIMRAQQVCGHFSNIYAALVAVLNTRVPEVTELLLARLILQLKKGYAEREKSLCTASLRFLAHLFCQEVIDEVPLLEFSVTCLMDPSNGSIELVICIIQECGNFLMEKTPQGAEMLYTRLREILHNGTVDYRTQILVDNAMEQRRLQENKQALLPDYLDLIDEDDVIEHNVSLQDSDETMEHLNIFSFDEKFDENESLYAAIREILVGEVIQERKPSAGEDNGDVAENEDIEGNIPATGETSTAQDAAKKQEEAHPKDMTESDLVEFRRFVYLKIMSAASFEECAHKLLNFMKSHQGMELELCKMVVECCSQEKSFLRYYGLLGQRFCFLSRKYVACFEEQFAMVYSSIHRYDTRKIRNIGTFFAALLANGALNWALMSIVRLVEEETTASSRIFLKVLFQEVAKTIGEQKMSAIFTPEKVPTLMPKENAKEIRFAINFFTSIGLGYVTEDLRELLKVAPQRKSTVQEKPSDDNESSLSSSSLSSSSLSSSSGISDDQEENLESSRKREGDNAPSDRPQKLNRS